MKRLIGTLSLVMLVGGCAAPLTTREKGVLAGGALGAGTGAIIGNQIGHQESGALIGGALGAVGGGLIGNQLYGQEMRQSTQAYELELQRRELERQRRELEDLRRDQYRSDSYDRSYDPYYDPYRYNREYNRYGPY